MNLLNKNLLIEDLKSKKWIPALISAFLFVILILSFVSFLSSNTNDTGNYVLDYVLSPFLFITLTLFPVIVFFVALYQFNFMHGKSKLDFYHGLPIKRETLFFTNYISGIILSFIPFIIFISLTSITLFFSNGYFRNGYFSNGNNILIFILCIRAVLLVFVGYSFIVLCCTVSGKLFSTIFVIITTIFAPFITVLTTYNFLQLSINTRVPLRNFIFSLTKFFFLFNNQGFIYDKLYILISSILIIILGILLTLIGINTYKKMSTEDTEKFLTNKRLYTFYKYLSAFTISITVVVIYCVNSNIFNNNYISFKSAALIMFLFFVMQLWSFLIISAIFDGGLNKNIFTPKRLAILLLITISYNTFTLLDPFNYREFTPDINKVDYVFFDEEYFDDPVLIEEITNLHRTIVANEIKYNNYEKSFDKKVFSDIYIEYYYKNGKVLTRRYEFDLNSEVYSKLNAFYTSNEYKESIINKLINFKNTDNIYESVPAKKTAIFTGFGSSAYNNNISELVDALILDIQLDDEFGFYNMQSPEYINLELYFDNDTYYYVNKRQKFRYNFSIKPTYTNVLKLINLDELIDNDFDYTILTYKSSLNNEFLETSINEGYNLTPYFYDDIFYDEYQSYNNGIRALYDSDTLLSKTLNSLYDNASISDIEIIDYKNDYDKFMDFYSTTKICKNKASYYTNQFYQTSTESDKDIYLSILIQSKDDNVVYSTNLGAFYK